MAPPTNREEEPKDRRLSVRRKADSVLVELVGRLIYDNLALAQEQLESLITSDLDHIFLKMKDLSYIDSSALGMLLSLNNHARTNGSKITMVSPPQRIRDIFVSTHLDTIFRIVFDEEADQIDADFALCEAE